MVQRNKSRVPIICCLCSVCSYCELLACRFSVMNLLALLAKMPEASFICDFVFYCSYWISLSKSKHYFDYIYSVCNIIQCLDRNPFVTWLYKILLLKGKSFISLGLNLRVFPLSAKSLLQLWQISINPWQFKHHWGIKSPPVIFNKAGGNIEWSLLIHPFFMSSS